jgi:hypothetical protein
MSFDQFQNSARLYVIGALEPEELQAFEAARKLYGTAAEDFIQQCYALHEAFALSLKPAKAAGAIKDKLMAMVRQRQGQSGAGPG